jgi:hypothetical protein
MVISYTPTGSSSTAKNSKPEYRTGRRLVCHQTMLTRTTSCSIGEVVEMVCGMSIILVELNYKNWPDGRISRSRIRFIRMVRRETWGCIRRGKNRHRKSERLPMSSCIHIVRVCNILPPVMMDSIFATFDLWEMFHPPFVMFTDVAIPPICRGDFACEASEVGEV